VHKPFIWHFGCICSLTKVTSQQHKYAANPWTITSSRCKTSNKSNYRQSKTAMNLRPNSTTLAQTDKQSCVKTDDKTGLACRKLTGPPPKMRLYLARSCMMPSTSGSCCCESETSLGMSNVMERLHIGHLHGCSTELCCHTLNMHSPAKYNIRVRIASNKRHIPWCASPSTSCYSSPLNW